MIACLDAGRRGICDAGDFVESEFIVISQVERQLLLGWKRENSLLQFHRHLIIIVDVIITSDELDSRGSRFQRNDLLSPLTDDAQCLIGSDAVNPASE